MEVVNSIRKQCETTFGNLVEGDLFIWGEGLTCPDEDSTVNIKLTSSTGVGFNSYSLPQLFNMEEPVGVLEVTINAVYRK